MWFKEKNILLKEAEEGGGASSEEAAVDTKEVKELTNFADSFTDQDDFDLSGLKEKSAEGEKEKGSEEEGEKEKGGKSGDKEDNSEEEKGSSEEEKDTRTEEEIKADEDAISEESEKSGKSVEDIKAERKEAIDKKQKEEKEDQKILDDYKDDLKKEGKSEKEIEAELSKKETEIANERFEASIDPFNDFKETPSEESSKNIDVDFSTIAKEMELIVDEGQEIKSFEDFKIATKNTIEKSKQTLDYDKYPPEVKMILENFIENGSLSVTDFYRNNTIRDLDKFMTRSVDDRIKSVLYQDFLRDGIREDQIPEAVEDKFAEMTKEDKESRITSINRDVVSLKTKEFDKIISGKKAFIEKQKVESQKIIKQERQNLVKTLKETKKFMGFKIPEVALNAMVKEVESGQFQKFIDNNVEKAKIYAYIGTKLGPSFEAAFQKALASAKGESYSKGIDTVKKLKHNITSGKSPANKNTRKAEKLSFSDDLFTSE